MLWPADIAEKCSLLRNKRVLIKDRSRFSEEAFEVFGAVVVVVEQLQSGCDHLLAL